MAGWWHGHTGQWVFPQACGASRTQTCYKAINVLPLSFCYQHLSEHWKKDRQCKKSVLVFDWSFLHVSWASKSLFPVNKAASQRDLKHLGHCECCSRLVPTTGTLPLIRTVFTAIRGLASQGGHVNVDYRIDHGWTARYENDRFSNKAAFTVLRYYVWRNQASNS